MSDEQTTLQDETKESLAKLALELAGSPATRKDFLGLVKKARPNASIPEVDNDAAVEARFTKEKEAREKFESEQRDRWLKEDLARQKNDVKAKFQLGDDDFPKMEEMMKKGELPADYKWAAQLYKQQTEQTAPTTYNGGGYGPLDIAGAAKEFDGLLENEAAWSNKTAHAMIDDMQKKGRAGAF